MSKQSIPQFRVLGFLAQAMYDYADVREVCTVRIAECVWRMKLAGRLGEIWAIVSTQKLACDTYDTFYDPMYMISPST